MNNEPTRADIQQALDVTGYEYVEEVSHPGLEEPVEGEPPPDAFPAGWGSKPTWRDEQAM